MEKVRKPRLLIISYWFPPAGGIPVQRALSLARYLPALGIEVHVMSPKNPPAPQIDPALLNLIPPEVTVHRVFTPMPPSHIRQRIWKVISGGGKKGAAGEKAAPAAETSRRAGWKSRISGMVRRFLSPDPEVVWTPFARRKARQIVRKYGIDTVLVTTPPYSSLLVTTTLMREFPHLRLIADFRDEWLSFFLSTFDFQKSSYIREQAERIERETVERAKYCITVTDSWVEEIRGRYPEQRRDKFVCIPNGFDPTVFASFRARPHGGTGYVVSYVGTVYSTTSPKSYLDALDSLPDDIRRRVETRFVGRIADEQRPVLDNRASPVKIFGFVPQKEALRHMEEADYLLVTMLLPTAATGKIYEYLATGKPILAIGSPDGELAQLLRHTRTGWCADPNDPEAVRALLEEAFAPQGSLLERFDPDREAIRSYERPRLAERFRDLIIS